MTNHVKAQKRAEKSPSLVPIADGDIFRVNVPASISTTGKRQRLKFESKKLAALEIDRIKGMAKRWGTESMKISAAAAEDAAKALSLLSEHNVTLTSTARHWLEWKAAQDASCTLSELWAEHTALKFSTVSDSYAKALEYYGAPIVRELGKVTVSALSTRQLEKSLEKHFRTPRQLANAKRTIRPALSFAIRRGYCSTNPFDQMEITKLPENEICVLTLAQVKAAFNACQDHRKSEQLKKSYLLDCSDCLPALAIMVFAGVRPKEMERLQWDAIHFDYEVVTIGTGVAKTRSKRNIHMEANLREWLELVPEDQRKGSITPPNWKEKIKAIRHIAKFSHLQDVLRHSFASYHLAANADLNALQEAMGHSTSEMILKHYRAIVKKQDAVKFWSIRPDSTEAKMEAVG